MLKKLLLETLSLFLVVCLEACGRDFSMNLKSQLQNCTPLVDYAENALFEQMDYITFGLDEHREPIQWIVLEKNGGKSLLLSKYLLASYIYNDKDYVGTTWENCTLRKWINSELMNLVFSKDEQESILTTEIINEDNDMFQMQGGNNTKDKLFLLSINEFERYFPNGSIATYENGYADWWWLRSPGGYISRSACVSDDGNTFYTGFL